MLGWPTHSQQQHWSVPTCATRCNAATVASDEAPSAIPAVFSNPPHCWQSTKPLGTCAFRQSKSVMPELKSRLFGLLAHVHPMASGSRICCCAIAAERCWPGRVSDRQKHTAICLRRLSQQQQIQGFSGLQDNLEVDGLASRSDHRQQMVKRFKVREPCIQSLSSGCTRSVKAQAFKRYESDK